MTANMLGRAITIAAAIHDLQTDKGGRAYILHPLRVMMRLRSDDEELNCIAVLHDAVEDSSGKLTVQDLVDEGFTVRVCEGVELLTHAKGDPYDAYIRRVAQNKDCIRVKREDLRDNADITRLKGIGPDDLKRMEKYHRAFLFLDAALAAMEKVGY